MTASCARRALAAALAVLAGRADTSPAQAAGPSPSTASAAAANPGAANPGAVSYEVFAFPDGPTTLCPGQTLVVRASVNQVTTRTGAAGRVTSSQSMPHAQLDPRLSNPSVGTLDPNVPTSISATPHVRGGFQLAFVFTAKKIGTTTIDISGVAWPVFLGPNSHMVRPTPARPITVTVACDYKISLYSTWQHPGERTLDILGVVQSARITPNSQGRFSTQATMSSTAVWIGGCPGRSRIQHSQVTIYGEIGDLDPSGLPTPVHVMVNYQPVSSTTTEGCLGKSKSDVGRPEQLDLRLDPRGETQTPSHILVTSPRLAGSTTVVLTKVRP
jgi:hypothetical protein